jgi:hypothetical protein
MLITVCCRWNLEGQPCDSFCIPRTTNTACLQEIRSWNTTLTLTRAASFVSPAVCSRKLNKDAQQQSKRRFKQACRTTKSEAMIKSHRPQACRRRGISQRTSDSLLEGGKCPAFSILIKKPWCAAAARLLWVVQILQRDKT